MAIAVLKDASIKDIDWVNPDLDIEVTLEDYLKEMREAELSGDMTFNQFQKNMNEWLAKNM